MNVSKKKKKQEVRVIPEFRGEWINSKKEL